jgi:amino acid transporter
MHNVLNTDQTKYGAIETQSEELDDPVVPPFHGHTAAEEVYAPVLLKGFDAFMAVTFVITSVSIVPSISTTFTFGVQNAGPFWLTWVWIVSSTLTTCVALSLGEICSTYSGSVYFWTGELASPQWAPVLSYICGWINFAAWVFGGSAMAYNCAQIAQAISLVNGSGEFSVLGLTVIACACMCAWALVNVFRIDAIGWINNIAAMFQVLATFATLLVALFLTKEYASPDFLWTPNVNFPAGKTEHAVFPIMSGLLFSLFALSGFDSGSQSSEETQDAANAAPRGMVRGCVISAIVGFLYSLGLLFLCPDMSAVLPPSSGGSGLTNQAMVNIFLRTCGKSVCIVLSIMLFVSVFLGGQTTLTVASRIAFSLARDGVLPKSLGVVHTSTDTPGSAGTFDGVPLKALAFVLVLDLLLLCLPLVSNDVFSAVVGASTFCAQVAYLMPIALRATVARHKFVKGPFNLGKWSMVHISFFSY